jgi:hypothetical protein
MRTRNSCAGELSASAAGIRVACTALADFSRAQKGYRRQDLSHVQFRTRENLPARKGAFISPDFFKVCACRPLACAENVARAGCSRVRKVRVRKPVLQIYRRPPFSRTRIIRTCHFSACAGTSRRQNIEILLVEEAAATVHTIRAREVPAHAEKWHVRMTRGVSLLSHQRSRKQIRSRVFHSFSITSSIRPTVCMLSSMLTTSTIGPDTCDIPTSAS